MNKAVDVRGLRVEIAASGADIVDNVTLSIDQGEILGLVGESGSGKTTVGLALLGFASRGVRIRSGRVLIEGTDVLSLDRRSLRDLRGRTVAYVPQDPSTALNPALRVGRQLTEVFDFHRRVDSRHTRTDRTRSVLAEVGLPTDDRFLRSWPHQLSGGQQQRVCLAMAFLLKPRVIVLDEPTTGLDVATQAQVLDIVRELCSAHGTAALYITHDLAIVSTLANRVAVMYGGRVVEVARTGSLFAASAHPYTAALLAAIPDISEGRQLRAIPGRPPAPGARPSACVFAPRCSLRTQLCTTEAPPSVELDAGHIALCHRAGEIVRESSVRSLKGDRQDAAVSPLLAIRDIDVGYRDRQVIHGASFDVFKGECVALVGESGCGKTTLSRAIVGLVPPSAGRLELAGTLLAGRARDRSLPQRRAVQYIFQNPYGSLNPRRPVGDIVRAPLRWLSKMSPRDTDKQVTNALERVNLGSQFADRYPDELSGGERQRVAIARALACRPDVIVCDEITSALDPSAQAAILDLLQRLQTDEQLALLFVTHNLALVRTLADRIAVLRSGVLVELGPTDRVLDRPGSPYTAELIRKTPSLLAVT